MKKNVWLKFNWKRNKQHKEQLSKKSFFSKLNTFFYHITFFFTHKIGKIKTIFLTYILTILFGSLLLYSPIAQTGKVEVKYIDALFTAASAFSDTGLTTLSTSTTWSYFGQAIIAILILLGGIGIFALKIYFFNWILKRPIKIFTRELINIERPGTTTGNTKKEIGTSISIIVVLIVISSIILTSYFYYFDGNFLNEEKSLNPQYDFWTSLRYGIFGSISSLNNAGFDIWSNSSIAPYYNNYFIQSWLIFLFVVGGIGYPVIYDLYEYSKSKIFYKFYKKRKENNFKVSLFTKISLIMYLVLTILGIVLVMFFELINKNTDSFWLTTKVNIFGYDYGSKFNRIMALIFSTMVTRSAGFSTINYFDLSSPSLLILSILMFIGSSPSSTGGGIRTTTLALIFLGLWSKFSSKPSIRMFKRSIPKDTVNNSFYVLILSLLIVFIGVVVSYTSSNNINYFDPGTLNMVNIADNNNHRLFNLVDILFDISSAFGTTGISTGVLSHLNISSKVTFIFIMFIGQLGISSTILINHNENNDSFKYDYILEDVAIG